MKHKKIMLLAIALIAVSASQLMNAETAAQLLAALTPVAAPAPCKADTYRLHGSCQQCPSGSSTYGIVGATSAGACLTEPGYYSQDGTADTCGLTFCPPCPNGLFSSTKGSRSCTACSSEDANAIPNSNTSTRFSPATTSKKACKCKSGYKDTSASTATSIKCTKN